MFKVNKSIFIANFKHILHLVLVFLLLTLNMPAGFVFDYYKRTKKMVWKDFSR